MDGSSNSEKGDFQCVIAVEENRCLAMLINRDVL